MTVVVLGDLNVDLEIVLPLAERAGDVHSHPPARLTGGGSAANTAVGLARLGVPTRFCGTVGSDGFGRTARQELTDEGIDTGDVGEGEAPTVVVVVVVPPDKERLIYVWPPTGGAHLELTPNRAVNAVSGASWVHVSGISLRGEPARTALIEAMRAAGRAGTTVSLDLNLRLEKWGWDDGFRAVAEAAVAEADIVFGAAEDEICPLAEAVDPEDAARSLAGHDRIVVARLGAEGVVACTPTQTLRVRAFPASVVDTVGAGDAFNAGYIAAAIEGAALRNALRWGAATAALCLEGRGARSLPDRARVQQLLGR